MVSSDWVMMVDIVQVISQWNMQINSRHHLLTNIERGTPKNACCFLTACPWRKLQQLVTLTYQPRKGNQRGVWRVSSQSVVRRVPSDCYSATPRLSLPEFCPKSLSQRELSINKFQEPVGAQRALPVAPRTVSHLKISTNTINIQPSCGR